MWFAASDLQAAIAAYYRLKNGVAADEKTAALRFAERAALANPIAVIEVDGYSEAGAKFRLHENVSNAHVAVLATCAYALRVKGVEQVVDMAESINKRMSQALLQGRLFTVGGF